MGDDELVEVDPRPSDTLIRKAGRKMEESKVIELVARWVLPALIGLASATAGGTVKDADHNAVVASNRAEVLALQEDVKMIREGFAQRVEVEERERENALTRIERRLTWLEAKLDISAPPAAAPAPAAPPTP